MGRAAAAGAGQWWVVWCWGVTEVWGHPWPCYCPLPPTLLLPPPPVTLLLPPPYLILLLPRHGDQGVQHCAPVGSVRQGHAEQGGGAGAQGAPPLPVWASAGEGRGSLVIPAPDEPALVMPTPDEHANIDLAAPSPALPPSSALQSPHLPGCLTPTLPAQPCHESDEGCCCLTVALPRKPSFIYALHHGPHEPPCALMSPHGGSCALMCPHVPSCALMSPHEPP